MDDYVSRETAMSMPLANGQYDHENSNEHFIFGLETYKEWLEQLPTADVRQVVYCRECIYNNKCFTQSFVESESIKSFDRNTFFCADGERREGGTP